MTFEEWALENDPAALLLRDVVLSPEGYVVGRLGSGYYGENALKEAIEVVDKLGAA